MVTVIGLNFLSFGPNEKYSKLGFRGAWYWRYLTNMTIAYKHETNKITGESKVIFLNTLFLEPFTNLNELLQQQKPVIHSMFPVKKYAQFRFIKKTITFFANCAFFAYTVYIFIFRRERIPTMYGCCVFYFFLRK